MEMIAVMGHTRPEDGMEIAASITAHLA